VSAVLLAGSLFMIMGFAAIAIDFGAGVNERRADQTAADTAALSAGVELIVSGSVQNAVDTVKAFTNDNLNRTVSNAQWAACTDADALAYPTDAIPGVANGSDCISFGPNAGGTAFAKIRVLLPEQTSPPFFSRVLGSTGIVTTAAAEIQLDNLFASGAFPAGVFSGAGAGDTFCIKTGTGASSTDSCGDPSTGDFGNFHPYFYTEVSAGNPSSLCTSGNQPAPLSRAMADGIDHFLGISPNPTGTKRNGINCPQFPGPLFPDQVDSGGGSSTSDITDGLIKGGSYDGSFTGRLTRKIWPNPWGTATIFNRTVDNRPLWSYIDPGAISAAGTPQSCIDAASGPSQNNGSQEAQFVLAQTNLKACLAAGNTPDSLFVEALYESPRLTIVPRYWESVPNNSNGAVYNIKAFVPVFIDGVWTKNGPQWTCNGGVINIPGNLCKHEPGRVGTLHINSAGNQKIDSASAIVLNCDVLPGVDPPEEKCKKVTSGGTTAEVYLNLYLTR
jgi:hypothetical protein